MQNCRNFGWLNISLSVMGDLFMSGVGTTFFAGSFGCIMLAGGSVSG